ncbi:MAG: hypothetical protein ABI682_03915 [Acidobacteriota bacterium]
MKRIAVVAFFLLLAASRSFGAPCVASPARLCLNGGRFATEVTWKDFQGNTGSGQAIALTGDTGYFWFFSSSNVELVVKVLDGRALNASYWVFYGALSNVEYTMTVTDTVTGNVKTYVNPSGSFGSVGDTSAFPGAGTVAPAPTSASAAKIEALSASTALALRESLLPAGAALPHQTVKRGEPASASAATPTCLATDTSLCLNGGRFRVEVEWTDFAGKTGVGTAVGLTGDTGYFWFFSSNNVELTVKVLDGRGLNSRFWVFYGALSNVAYDMTVTDTLTGNVNTYSNPSGRFASTGDTEGFRVGSSVAVSLAAGAAVIREIPVEGGEITATGVDGSTYSLRIPADALLSPQEITMTPASRIDGLPLSGGLASAVQLGPDGLFLFKPATLTITPARAVPLSSQVTFSWRGSGEEFFLYPPAADQTPLSLSVVTLAGYGSGAGTDSDVQAQVSRIPARASDELFQNLEPLFGALRTSGQPLGRKAVLSVRDDIRTKMVALLRNHYRTVVLPRLQAKSCGRGREGIIAFHEWIVWINSQSALGASFQAELDEGNRLEIAVLERCYNEYYDSCKRIKNPDYGFGMVGFYRDLKQRSVQGLVDATRIQRCLTFTLDFGSRIVDSDETLSFSEFVLGKHSLAPDDPGEPWILTENGSFVDGQSCTLSVGAAPCATSTTCDWSGLSNLQLYLSLNLSISGGSQNVSPRLRYLPDKTKSSLTIHACAADGDAEIMRNVSVWWLDYVFTLHFDEFDGALTATQWKHPSVGSWQKNYDRPSLDGKLKENSTLILAHTPD